MRTLTSSKMPKLEKLNARQRIHYRIAHYTLKESFFGNPEKFYSYLNEGLFGAEDFCILQDPGFYLQRKIDWNAFSAFTCEMGPARYSVIQFPTPEVQTEAFYVCSSINSTDTKGNPHQYFTLERTVDHSSICPKGLLCSWTDRGHLNSGVKLTPETPFPFLAAIHHRITGNKVPAKAFSKNLTIPSTQSGT